METNGKLRIPHKVEELEMIISEQLLNIEEVIEKFREIDKGFDNLALKVSQIMKTDKNAIFTKFPLF